MHSKRLFLFDFDGVIVDGMDEYWHSALLAYEKFLNSPEIYFDQNLYKQVPNIFVETRPWVKYGWEMLIIVHEIIKKDNPLNNNNKTDFLDKYHQNCEKVLLDNSWVPGELQKCLDKSREYQINKDFNKWVDLHKPFYEVIEFIEKLKQRKISTGIITTKGKSFAEKILKKLHIFPELIFGYESGTKVDIVSELTNDYKIIGFIEDRKKTLINIKQNSYITHIPCYLAEWGYLKNTDRTNLPHEIKLLKIKDLEQLLAI